MSFVTWWRWLRGRKPGRDVQVIMYTRQGCHLCEQAWELLQAEQQRYGFQLEAVDVDRSQELVALYGEKVPVVVIDGKERFHGQVNRVLLRRLFDCG